MAQYVPILVLFLAGAIFPVANFVVTTLLKPHYPDREKLVAYESGEIPYGDAIIKYRVQYYVFALAFLIFDVEAVFLFPWAVRFQELGLLGLVEMGIFIAILVVGLIYAYQKKVLRWA